MDYIEAKEGFSVGSVIAVVVGIIVLVAVAVPITTETVEAQNFSGTNETIADILPTLMLVGAILLVVSLYSSN
jgi:hypothetical protein